MDRARRFDLLAVGLMVLPLFAGMFLWPELPSQLAIHWGASGSPDSFVSKQMATIGIFAFGVGIVVFTRLAPSSLTNTPGGENVSILFIGAVFASVQSMVLVWNLGYHFDIWVSLLPILVLTGLLVVSSRILGK